MHNKLLSIVPANSYSKIGICAAQLVTPSGSDVAAVHPADLCTFLENDNILTVCRSYQESPDPPDKAATEAFEARLTQLKERSAALRSQVSLTESSIMAQRIRVLTSMGGPACECTVHAGCSRCDRRGGNRQHI